MNEENQTQERKPGAETKLQPTPMHVAVIKRRHLNKSPRVHHRNLEVDTVKIGIIEDGDTNVTFAAKAGMTFGTLAFEMSTGFKNIPARWKVEKAFGYRRAIWSTPEQLAQRAHCFKIFGVDPFLLTREEIKAQLPQIDFTGLYSRKEVVGRIFEKAAIYSKPQTKTGDDKV